MNQELTDKEKTAMDEAIFMSQKASTNRWKMQGVWLAAKAFYEAQRSEQLRKVERVCRCGHEESFHILTYTDHPDYHDSSDGCSSCAAIAPHHSPCRSFDPKEN